MTISGGEPFEQPEALQELLRGLDCWRSQCPTSFDILGYSGLGILELKNNFPDIVAMFDALIPEPFMQNRPLGGCWRGSDNQPLHIVTDLGRRRYSNYINEPAGKKGAFQVIVDGQAIWLIGLPDRGDMQRLQKLASSQGLIWGGISWQP